MSTLGKTATPNTGTHGFFAFASHPQVAMLFTVPAGGGIFTDVNFWAAGSSTLKIHGVIWDSSGNVLAFGPGVNTSGGAASFVGATQWYQDTFASPVFIAGGTQIYIGWQRDAGAGTVYWAYNGSDHSPSAQWNGNSGSTGQSFSGHSIMDDGAGNEGAVAAYADYTPGSIYADDGSAFQGGVIVYADNGAAWQQCEVYVDDGAAWQRIG